MLSIGTIVYMAQRYEYHIIYEINKNNFYTRTIAQAPSGEMYITNSMNAHSRSSLHKSIHMTHNGEHMDIVIGNVYRKCVGKGDYIMLIAIDNLGSIDGVGHTQDFYKFSYLDASTGVKGEIILLKKDFSLYFSSLS